MLLVPLQVVALKTKVADFSGFAFVTGKLGQAASFCGFLVQVLLSPGFLETTVEHTSQPGVSLLMPLAHWHALNLDTCYHPCHAVKEVCTCPTLAVRYVHFLRR